MKANNKDKAEWSAPSERIKALLKERGLTQQDLARMLTSPSGEEVTLQNVKQLLNKPSMRTDTLKRIADSLEVPIWQLFASPAEVSSHQFVSFFYLKGQTHTPNTMEEVMDILKDWNGDKFHKLCLTRFFDHLEDVCGDDLRIGEIKEDIRRLLSGSGQ